MKHKLTPVAKSLRKKETDQERKLWRLLKARQLVNLKFRRQYPIANYIVDFCCPAKKLILEIDGGQHNEDRIMERDKQRDEFFQKEGFRVLRFWNNEIDNNLEGVYQRIIETLN